MEKNKKRFIVTGMSCANCAINVKKAVEGVSGIKEVSVNPVSGEMWVQVEGLIDEKKIKEAVEKAGYGIKEESRELTFAIGGMSCTSCAQSVEKALKSLDGVIEARVDFASSTASVKVTDKISIEKIEKVVEAAGYSAKLLSVEATESVSYKKEIKKILITLLIGIPILIITYGKIENIYADIIQTVAALGVLIYGGSTFFRGAWFTLKNKTAGMDVLVSLGLLASIISSLLSTFGVFQNRPYYETVLFLIVFIRTGKVLEEMAKRRASDALRGLLQLRPNKVLKKVKDNEYKEVSAEELVVGDIVKVRPGDLIPSDGVVISGTASVDESLITGEAKPVLKEPDERVTGGTKDLDGVLLIKIDRIGQDTFLANIIKLVSEAQRDKPNIQKLADRISAIFVPVVVSISLMTLFFWWLYGANAFSGLSGKDAFLFALNFAISVLVIACPCALGLATPAAVMVGMRAGLSLGILVKKASSLEAIAKTDIIFFDKTGTITEGVFEVISHHFSGSVNEAKIHAYVAALESMSNHPVANAVSQYAKSLSNGAVNLEVKEVKEVPGMGIMGIVDGKRVWAGNIRLFEKEGLTDRLKDLDFEKKKSSVIAYVEDVGQVSYIFGDGVRENSKKAVAILNRLNIETYMITGDSKEVAQKVASEVGIKEFSAELLPHDKLALIREKRESGATVAMVGDGINDAPALALSDVGIAMGGGTDIAKESGDIVLIKSDILDVPRAVLIGRASLRKIKQNLLWAFIYNTVAIPVAAGLFYPNFGVSLKPEFAGLAMAFSSISVVMSSLLLGRIKKRVQNLE